MVQRSQKLRFALEAREALRRLGKDRGKDFDGDLTLEFRIARDSLSHATRTNGLEDLAGPESGVVLDRHFFEANERV